MKKVLKIAVKYFAIYLVIIIIFLSLLTLVSLIPSKAMKENVRQSAEILSEQSNRLFISIRYVNVLFDNFTDALMVNTAYSIDSKTPFYSAMVARKNYIPGITREIFTDTKGELRSASKYKQLDQVGELRDTVYEDIDESFEYARYWHGYLVFLRPILCLMNINVLRIIMLIVFGILGIVLVFIIARKINVITAVIIGIRTFT